MEHVLPESDESSVPAAVVDETEKAEETIRATIEDFDKTDLDCEVGTWFGDGVGQAWLQVKPLHDAEEDAANAIEMVVMGEWLDALIAALDADPASTDSPPDGAAMMIWQFGE